MGDGRALLQLEGHQAFCAWQQKEAAASASQTTQLAQKMQRLASQARRSLDAEANGYFGNPDFHRKVVLLV